VPGTVDIGNHCNDCSTFVHLPFPAQLYDSSFTGAIVGSNGTLGFVTNANPPANTCLSNPQFNYAILPHWDDLITSGAPGLGVFTSVSGSAPDRIFNIEWRARRFGGVQPVNFEVRLHEGRSRFDIIYGLIDGNGGSATIGVQRDTGSQFTQHLCNIAAGGGGIQPGLMLTFDGPEVPPTPEPTPTPGCTLNPDYSYSVTTNETTIPATNLVPGSVCHGCVVGITLPFPYTFYDQTFSAANVSPKGSMQFVSSLGGGNNACLPSNTLDYAILPFWDDFSVSPLPLIGVYTDVIGTAPNRILIVQWKMQNPSGPSSPNWEVFLYEGQPRLDFIYGSAPGRGASATIGIQEGRGTGYRFTQFSCNAQSINAGYRLTFDRRTCPDLVHTHGR
jgi:hypothetical protein